MACTACGGSDYQLIADGFVECTSTIYVTVPTGAHPSGIQGPPYQQVASRCGNRYHVPKTGGGPSPSCHLCTTDSIGSCATCGKRVCGDHSGQFDGNRRCSTCIGAAMRVRQQRADQEAAAAAQRTRDREAADAQAHRDRVLAHEGANPEARRRELTRLQQSLNSRRGSQNVTAGTGFGCFAILFLPGLLLGAAIVGDTVNGAYNPTAFTLGIVFAAVIPLLLMASSRAAEARRRSLGVRIGELSRSLGCGVANCSRCRAGL
jgi:hypothetical protein